MYITSDCLIIETVFFYRMSVQFLKNYDQLLNHHYLNTWNIWKWTRLHDFLQSKRSGVAEVKYAMIASLYGTYTLMIIISSRFMMGWPLVSVINSAHTTGNYTIYRNLSIIVNPVMLRLAIKCLKKKCTYGSFYFFKYMSFFSVAVRAWITDLLMSSPPKSVRKTPHECWISTLEFASSTDPKFGWHHYL